MLILFLLQFPQTSQGEEVNLLKSLQGSFGKIEDYKCKFTKIELIGKKYMTDVMKYSFKKPKSIRMDWIEPKKVRGQLAVYHGKELKVVPTWLPVAVTLDPDSKKATGGSKYRIYDSDLGAISEMILNTLKAAESVEFVENGSKTVKILVKTDKDKNLIWIDRRYNLPVKIERFNHENKLIDGFTIEELELNVGLDDEFFDI